MYVKSSCKYLREDRLGAWVNVLSFKGNTKILKGYAFDTTDRRMLWIALIEGVKQLKEPCKINIYTVSAVGMKGSTNKDLREEFLKEVKQNKHEFEFILTSSYNYKLSRILKKYYQEIEI